jgi:hypothetical protein
MSAIINAHLPFDKGNNNNTVNDKGDGREREAKAF